MKIPTGSVDEAREAISHLDAKMQAARERAEKRRARLELIIRDVWNDMEREIEPMRRQREAIVRTLVDFVRVQITLQQFEDIKKEED